MFSALKSDVFANKQRMVLRILRYTSEPVLKSRHLHVPSA